MAQLIVRNLEDDVRDKLRDLAELHGRSMEEEIREILRAAVIAEAPAQPGLGTQIRELFADCHLDQDFEIPKWYGSKSRPANFDE